MSRHRNIRSMNYTDEYDGYDDVYGHSVEDDYCMSPSQATFMYNRDAPQKIGAFMASQNDIVEEDEDDELAKAKLESCIEAMKDTFGTTLTRQQMVDSSMRHNYNHEKAIQEVLDSQVELQEKKDLTQTNSIGGFSIPKFSMNSKKMYSGLTKKIDLNSTSKPLANNAYNSLSALTSSHLKTAPNTNLLKFSTRPSTTGLNFPKKIHSKNAIDKENTDSTIIKLGNCVEDLKLTKSESSLPKENKTDSDWCLNLTNSLLSERKPSSAAIMLKDNLTEPMITSSGLSLSENVNQGEMSMNSNGLTCSFDVRNLLRRIKKANNKKVSQMGKIICRNYDMFVPFVPRLSRPVGVRQFAFTVPSPDDIIQRHLRRK